MLETLNNGYETFSLNTENFEHEIWKLSINLLQKTIYQWRCLKLSKPIHEKLWTMNIIAFNRDVGNYEQRIWNFEQEIWKLSNRNIRNFQSIHDKLFTTNITALNRDIKTLNNEYKNFQLIREKLWTTNIKTINRDD